jgi:hypothetical protein
MADSQRLHRKLAKQELVISNPVVVSTVSPPSNQLLKQRHCPPVLPLLHVPPGPKPEELQIVREQLTTLLEQPVGLLPTSDPTGQKSQIGGAIDRMKLPFAGQQPHRMLSGAERLPDAP